MSIPCKTSILPSGYTGSTYLNNKIETYADLALRVKKALGYPRVEVEVADSQLADFIDRAIEMYTRYAGYTEEYLVFDSNLYTKGVGIKLDELLTGDMCSGISNIDSTINLLRDPTCYFTVTTATSTTETYLGSAVCNIQAQTLASSGNTVVITPSTNNPWNFQVCEADKVTVTTLSSYPSSTLLYATTGMLNVSAGDVTIYSGSSYNLPASCTTPPLTTLWGYNITTASHVSVMDIPQCALTQTYLTMLSTDGNTIKSKICDTTLDSSGFIPVSVAFYNHYTPPTAVFGEFDLTSNKIFNLSYTASACCQSMPSKLGANIEFYSTSTVEYTGTSAVSSTTRMDYSLDKLRKVASVFSFEAGSFTNTNILFNIDYAIAQRVFGQTSQFSHIQHTGFDLISYEILRQWVDLTDRILARKVYVRFDPKTQYMNLIPEPADNGRYCAAIGCYLERPVEDVINEKWVFEYVVALTKIALGHIRGKFGSITLFGGGQINADVGSQGLTEKEKLEQLLLTGGEGPSVAPFFIG